MSSSQPIAITGVGAVCGAGLTIDDIWNAIVSGQSAVKEVSSWDASHWPVRVAAEVTGVDNRTLVEDRKLHKMISKSDLFGLYAARKALEQSGLVPYRETLAPEAAIQFNDRSGVFAGSGGGNYTSNYDFFPVLTAAQGDLRKFGNEFSQLVNPMWLLRHLPNNVLCHVGIRHGFKGTNACVTNQCAGGMLALTALRQGVVPGIATLRTPDPEILPFPVSHQPQSPRSDIALILCRGFGAMTVALLVRAPRA